MQFTDAERIDYLERMANEPGGLLLHDGSEHGRTGLGLRPGALVRTLREAIDNGLRHERGIEAPRSMSDMFLDVEPEDAEVTLLASDMPGTFERV